MGIFKEAIMAGPSPIFQMPEYENVELICSEHGKYNGVVCITPEGKKAESECPVCEYQKIEQERKEFRQKHERRWSEHQAKKIFKESSMPRIFEGIEFDHYKPTCNRAQDILNRMKTYAEKFSTIQENGACALLTGRTGTGKTMLASAVGNYIMSRGNTVFYTKCPRALSRVKRTWKPSVPETQEEEIDKYRKPDLLIFDELPKGCTSAKDWEIIHDILDRRTEDRKPTISITTMTAEELEKKLGGEIMRRLHHKGRILKFDWETYQENHLF